MKTVMAVILVATTAACYPDKSPGYIERSAAFEKCTGTWAGGKRYSEVSDQQLLGCTQAVYGN